MGRSDLDSEGKVNFGGGTVQNKSGLGILELTLEFTFRVGGVLGKVRFGL